MDAIFNWISENPIPTIIIVVVIFLIFTYNNLNAKKKRVEKSASTIDVYFEKRFDEISALLEQVERVYEHEESVYSQVSALRSGIATAKVGTINDKVNMANNISNMLAIPGLKAEAYPELQSIKNNGMFVMNKTSENENDLAAARKQYNNNATSYNTLISSFPTNLVAGIFGFKEPFVLFKVTEGKKERPTMANVAKTKKEALKEELEMQNMELKAELERKAMIKKAELEMREMEGKQTEAVVDTPEHNENSVNNDNKVE